MLIIIFLKQSDFEMKLFNVIILGQSQLSK